MSYYLTPVRMAGIKTRWKRCGKQCGEKATHAHCWWECKLVHPLWKTIWRFLKKLEIEDLAIAPLGIHPKEMKTKLDEIYAL